jgi:hypothetical protein
VGSSLNYLTVLDTKAAWLEGKQRNDTSQFGEDGLIEAVLSRIGETNRWCFEVGAADGEFFSNTKRLRQAGWTSVLIEAGRDQYAILSKLSDEKTYTFNECIRAGSLDRILSSVGAPRNLDLGVIDIDGQEYWVWKSMDYRPRVMLVEFAYYNEPGFIPLEDGPGQAGLEAIVSLGRELGYTALAKTYCNVLFALTDLWKDA